MRVLVIGGGGREHALAWKAAQSEHVETIYVAPGNAGTAEEEKIENVAIAVDDIAALIRFCQNTAIDLTLVGPEVPLVAGIVDQFQAAKLNCFGPSQKAAQLEGSKVFCKDFLQRHNIPTASYASFTDLQPAKAYIAEIGVPVVIKADGLAAGKGVIIANTETEAVHAVTEMLDGGRFGSAGNCVVIERFLQGEEASFIAITDGRTVLPLASSQDHKARDNQDRGPNTGGMGAYSPAPVITAALHEHIMQQVMIPTVRGMQAEGCPYVGFLYAGLMITADGTAHVLEFNCRFGDPEAQPVMMRLQSDIVMLCQAAVEGRLDQVEITWNPQVALGVVMAAQGYPEAYPKGDEIFGLTQVDSNIKVFHAGTATNNGKIVTSGGRVLCVCAMGDNVTAAQKNAYAGVAGISWNEPYYRTDIGHRAIARES